MRSMDDIDYWYRCVCQKNSKKCSVRANRITGGDKGRYTGTDNSLQQVEPPTTETQEQQTESIVPLPITI